MRDQKGAIHFVGLFIVLVIVLGVIYAFNFFAQNAREIAILRSEVSELSSRVETYDLRVKTLELKLASK